MTHLVDYQNSIRKNGFAIVPDVFDATAIQEMIDCIELAETTKSNFRKTDDLFAIRQFLKEIPSVETFIFSDKFNNLLSYLFGLDYFVVKSIYFDKPEKSNWFVAYHQDLTISVNNKVSVAGYGPWTVKQNQFAVQPPLAILEQNFTVRIHLDDTTTDNGALKVIPQSHKRSIYRATDIDWTKEKEVTCEINKGDIMIMRPLLLHASNRTTNAKRRRVIHIEFSNTELPIPLQWAERK